MKLFWHRTEEAFEKIDAIDTKSPTRLLEMDIQHTRLQLMLLSAIADALWSIAKGRDLHTPEEYH